jgi:hypothetical protein
MQVCRVLRRSTAAVVVVVLIGCAHGRQPRSYLPVGSAAWYGDQTSDGATVLLHQEAGAALERLRGALRTAGYEIEHSANPKRALRTTPRQLGVDTTMVIEVQIIPVELPEPASTLVLTGTYSVPSLGIHNAPVVQRSGEANPLYARFRRIVEALRESRAPTR